MFKLKVSWCYALAGVFAAFAVSVILGLLGLALGFTVIDPMSAHPFAGLGTAFGIWSIVSILLSLAVGGFVAGYFAGTRGCEHGFLVWTVAILAGATFGSAVGAIGSAARAVAGGAMSAVSGVGGGIADAAGGMADAIQDKVKLDIDPGQIRDNVASVLRDTGVKTLQPEYLHDQLREARSDLRNTMNQIRLAPDDYEQAISAFLDRQEKRVEGITADVDRNAAVNALMKRRDMSRAEAENAVDNAMAAYRHLADGARAALAEARQEIHDAGEYLKQAGEIARVKADKFTRTAAKSAMTAAVTLVVGAVASCWAGYFGVRRYLRRYRL